MAPAEAQVEMWRRACGCMRTSDKLKQMLRKFPEPPPPTPACMTPINYVMQSEFLDSPLKQMGTEEVIPNYKFRGYPANTATTVYLSDLSKLQDTKTVSEGQQMKCWHFIMDVVSLIQLSVVATALAIYYLIYCYMQLVYYTLRSAVYFHNADGPMKVTIAVVTVTTVIIGLHVITKVERFLKIV